MDQVLFFFWGGEECIDVFFCFGFNRLLKGDIWEMLAKHKIFFVPHTSVRNAVCIFPFKCLLKLLNHGNSLKNKQTFPCRFCEVSSNDV